MYATQPRPRRPIGYGQQVLPAGDFEWKLRWPFIITIIIAVVIIIFSITIFGLEIASLAKGTGTAYGNTASTGAGIWCGFFIFVAGVLILLISKENFFIQKILINSFYDIEFMRRTKLWATIAFIATIVAACFSVILIGLDAKAVHDGVTLGNLIQLLLGYYYFAPKYRILAAELAFACAEFILCLIFIIIYLAVLISSPRGRGRPQMPIRPPLR
jgi:hypothetical protein